MNLYAWPGQVACLLCILFIILGTYLGRRRLGIRPTALYPNQG